MIFTVLITIVFIAELIIAFAIILNLFKFDKTILGVNKYLTNSRFKILEVCALVRGISEQLVELAPIWVEQFRLWREKLVLNQVKRLISGILFLRINIKVVRLVRKSKLAKLVWKGLTLVQNVI